MNDSMLVEIYTSVTGCIFWKQMLSQRLGCKIFIRYQPSERKGEGQIGQKRNSDYNNSLTSLGQLGRESLEQIVRVSCITKITGSLYYHFDESLDAGFPGKDMALGRETLCKRATLKELKSRICLLTPFSQS